MRPDHEKIHGIGVLDDNVFEGRKSLAKSIRDFFDPSSSDRRRTPRVNISVPVFCQVNGEKRSNSGKSVDFSTTGIRISLVDEVKLGSRLDMEIKLPNMEELFKVSGVVVWCRPSSNQGGAWDCGIAFENLRQAPKKEKMIALIADTHARIALVYTREYIASPVQTIEEMTIAFRIAYKEYLRRGYCGPNKAQMHYSFFSLLPSTTVFWLQEQDGRFLGTISLIGDSPCGIPMESLFPEEIQILRKQGRNPSEVGFLALDTSQFQKGFFALTNLKKQARLFRLCKIMSDYARFIFKTTDLIIGVHPKHHTLYNYIRFQPAGQPRSYPGAEGNPALLMRLDLEKAVAEKNQPDYVCGAYFFDNAQAPPEVLLKRFEWDIDHLVQFLLEKKSLWDNLTVFQQDYLEQCYPGLKAAVKDRKTILQNQPPESIIITSLLSLRMRMFQR